LQSQDFTTTWTVSGTNATVTTNTSVAPDGTTTADTLTEDSATGIHACYQGVIASGVVTLSVFAKLGSGTRFLTIAVNRDATHSGSATFDLSLGTNTQTQANGGIYASPSATITAVAQGFYRCTFTITTDTVAQVRIGLNDTGTPATNNRGLGAGYTGNSTSSLILWGAQLEQRSAVTAYTATTTAPITNYIPQLLTAASGVARFDHNPTTFESLGLEIEESRTNLFTYSEQFDNAAWTKSATTITANTIIAPDGALTGDKLVEDTANTSHSVTRSQGVTTGASYALTVYAKAAERSFFRLQSFNATSDAENAVFNLATGTIVSQSGTSASTITPVGNGWYRCSVILINDTDTSSAFSINLFSDATTSSYTGDGYSGIYIWGAQLEAGAFPTSYIPTVASQVTRAADAASMTGTNFSSWYNQAEGSFFAQFIPASSSFGANKNLFLSSDGTANNYAGLRYTGSGAEPTFSVVVAGTAQAAISTGAMVAGTSYKMAGAYEANDFAVSRNAGTVGTDTSGTVPVVTQAEIGMLAGTSFSTQTISKLAYYPLRVTNAQLQGLTS
jgi:hypothetical protein